MVSVQSSPAHARASEARWRRSEASRRTLRLVLLALAIALLRQTAAPRCVVNPLFEPGGVFGPKVPGAIKLPQGCPKPAEIKPGGPKDLLVIGCGKLGRRCATAWKAVHKDARVVGATLSTESHGKIWKQGIEPIKVDELDKRKDLKFAHILYAPPPSGNKYVEETSKALGHWTGAGGFAITSAGYVYTESAGGAVTEASPIFKAPFPETPSVEKKIEAETLVQAAGGTVIRFSALYDMARGPHKYWFRNGAVTTPKDAILGMVHYDDAASAAVTILNKAGGKKAGGDIVNVDDGAHLGPEAALEAVARVIDNQKKPDFKPGSDPFLNGKGAKVDPQKLMGMGWKPQWASFDKFMASQKTFTSQKNSPPKAK